MKTLAMKHEFDRVVQSEPNYVSEAWQDRIFIEGLMLTCLVDESSESFEDPYFVTYDLAQNIEGIVKDAYPEHDVVGVQYDHRDPSQEAHPFFEAMIRTEKEKNQAAWISLVSLQGQFDRILPIRFYAGFPLGELRINALASLTEIWEYVIAIPTPEKKIRYLSPNGYINGYEALRFLELDLPKRMKLDD